MTDQNPRDQKTHDYELLDAAAAISHCEELISQLATELSRPQSNSAEVTELKRKKAGQEAALRTMKLLKGAKEVEFAMGRSAAAFYLGENIGGGPKK